MPDMAKHASPESSPQSSAKVFAWAVLVTMGGTSVTMNIWDATHTGDLYPLIAVLKGLAPVLAAMGLSEVGARLDGGKVFRWVAFGIMAGAMALSASAIASVLRPSDPAGIPGLIMSWLFGLVLDAAALTALWAILTERERRRESANAAEAKSVEQQIADAVAAAESRMSAESQREAHSLHERIADLQALLDAAHERSRQRSKGHAPKARKSAPGSADTQDLTTELRAMQMLDAHPELKQKGQGAELARRLGVHPSHGRRLHARLTSEERPAESLQERSPERGDERSEERSEERSS